MTDRAQFTTPRIVPVALVSILILVLVLNQVFTALPEPGSVENVCLGVCGCGACPPAFYAVPVIGLVVLVASLVVSFPKSLEQDDE